MFIKHKGCSREKFPVDSFFLNFFLQSDNELLVSEMKKKGGVTDFVPEIKRLENYPDFEKMATRNSAWATGVYS